MHCRYCGLDSSYKNGFIKGKQRYKCKNRGKNFQEKDGRTKESTLAKQALAIALYIMCRVSYIFFAKKIFKCSPATIMNWIKRGAKTLLHPMKLYYNIHVVNVEAWNAKYNI
ncbi:hypothetical protein FACS189472_00540 [Alphaproteobacteria bacterium]|nr:hypothetical protein FACS189472_00540 [Alphaproteobacteria bacterium]